MKYLIFLFFSQIAMADQWFCKDESGKREGNTIWSCGVGQSIEDEGYARKRALEAAINEFQTICGLSYDCKGRKVNIEPKRTECVKDKAGIINCYRLVVAEIIK